MFFSSASVRTMSHCCGDHGVDAELGQADFHLAGFHFGQVEDVVDHFEQVAAGFLDVLGVAFLLVVEGLERLEHFGEADDAVERRAQLVAHGGEEFAFEAVHLVELHVEVGQLIDFVVELGVGLVQLALRLDEVARAFC